MRASAGSCAPQHYKEAPWLKALSNSTASATWTVRPPTRYRLGWTAGHSPPPTSRAGSPTTASSSSRRSAGASRTCASWCPRSTCGAAPARPAPSALPATWPRPRSTRLAFTDMQGRARRWEESLPDTYTDGILVLHRGRRIYERYFRRAAGPRAARVLLHHQVLRRDAVRLARARGHAGRTPAHSALAAGDEGHGLRGRHLRGS